jgi:hypothetical protein
MGRVGHGDKANLRLFRRIAQPSPGNVSLRVLRPKLAREIDRFSGIARADDDFRSSGRQPCRQSAAERTGTADDGYGRHRRAADAMLKVPPTSTSYERTDLAAQSSWPPCRLETLFVRSGGSAGKAFRAPAGPQSITFSPVLHLSQISAPMMLIKAVSWNAAEKPPVRSTIHPVTTTPITPGRFPAVLVRPARTSA